MSKTRVIPLRLENEQADYIDMKVEEWGKSRGKVVSEIMDAYKSIELLCEWGGIEARECCKQIEELFREGKIEIREGRINVKEEEDAL